MVKKIAVGLLLLTGRIYADSTTVSADTGFGGPSNPAQLFDNPSLHGGSDVPLTGGSTLDGDGAVIQIGYFDGATTANNFLGNFVPLTGEGSLNTATVPGSSTWWDRPGMEIETQLLEQIISRFPKSSGAARSALIDLLVGSGQQERARRFTILAK